MPTLSPRQTRFYTERIDMYELVSDAADVETYRLVASNVPCMYWATTNYDQITGGFRKKQDGVMTADRIHTHVDEVDVTANMVIHVKSGSVRQADTWHRVQGAAKRHEFRAKYQEVYVIGFLPLKPGQIVP